MPESLIESFRLAALYEYGLFDSPREQIYDDLTELAAKACEAPSAVICLIDAKRVWVKSSFGTTLQETTRENSLFTAVLKAGKFDFVEDSKSEIEPGVRFTAAVPLINKKGFVLGAVCVMDRVPRSLTDAQKSTLQALARQTLAHFENQKEKHTIEVLTEVGRTIAGELDHERLVQSITDAGVKLSHAQFGAFFYHIFNAEGEKNTLFTVSGAPREAFSKFPLPRSTTLFGRVFIEAKVHRSENIKNDPDYGNNPPYSGLPPGHLPVTSYLGVPVVSRTGEVIGGLFFGHSEEGVFTEREEQIVVGLASQASVAMDNARLYKRLKENLEEVIESRERFQQIAESISEVFWMISADKNQMIYISPAYERIWGRSCESLYKNPTSFLEGICEEDRSRVIEALPKQRSGGYDMTYRVVQPNGNIRWVRDRAYGIKNDHGEVYRLVGIAQDITEQVNSENLIEEQRAKIFAGAKATALGEMAGGIAHEINNPLAIILGRASQLKRNAEMGALSLETAAKYAGKIEDTAFRISKIVKSLRAISRDGDNDPFVIADLNQIVSETLELCHERFKVHNVKLITSIPHEIISIECRPVQIAQVLLNVLNNAHDAVLSTPDPEKWVRISIALAKDNVELAVRDSGPGVPEGIREKIFQPLFTTKEVGKGTGLGLSISKSVAEAHKGSITIDSKEVNTCFVLRLPLKQN